MAPATTTSMNAGQLASIWERQRSVVCKAIRDAKLDVAKGTVYSPEQQQQIWAVLPPARPPRKQQQPATPAEPPATTPQQQKRARQQHRQQRLATAILEPQQQQQEVQQQQGEQQEVVVTLERLTLLETALLKQQVLINRLVDRSNAHTTWLKRHDKETQALGKDIYTLWFRIFPKDNPTHPAHGKGDTPGSFRAIRLDQIDEGGQETLEKLASLHAENEAWIGDGLAKAVERQAEERAKSA